MKHKWKRLTAILLVCTMAFGMLFSGTTYVEKDSDVVLENMNGVSRDILAAETAESGTVTEDDMKNISAEAASIRKQMVQRKSTISGSFEISDIKLQNEIYNTLKNQIFIYTSASDEGDYLRRHTGKTSWSYDVSDDGNVTTFSYELQASYYTDLEQEQEVAGKIEEVLAELSLDGLSEYEKAKKIHRYIAVNVSYDYENLNDDSYKLKYSAYAALIQGTAVCQGYSSLFYRMAHEAGLSARIVSGLVDGEAHAWNMIKINDLYYYSDVTHASTTGNTSNYFLKGSISFSDRQLDSEYLTDDFIQNFPVSEFDYESESDYEDFKSGQLTSSIDWSVKTYTDENGVVMYSLELDGTGAISDYSLGDELPWEEWRDEITIVTINSGITRIGNYVFSNMSELTTVQIANTVTSIGDGVFYNCPKLTNLQIPDSVTEFGQYAIGGSYGQAQWDYNPSAKKLVITGDGAMGEPYVEGSTTERNASRVPWNRYRDQIEEVVIKEGIINLSTYALNGMSSMTVVTLPSTLEEIGEGSFESCTALTYICIPDSVKTIGHYAFRYCEGLRSIHIPASVTSIGVRAFADCPYLHEFYFYGDAPKFENQAIMDSEYITVYYNGSGWSEVKSLFEYLTFETWEPGEYDDSGTNVSDEGIKSQTSGKYGEDIEWSYDEESAVLTLSGKGNMADPITIVTVDETTNTTITSYSTNAVPWNPFNQQIKEVVISDGITSISRYAFWWLTQIENIIIPDSVITVGQQSFVHCSKLQKVTLGEDLTTIGKNAFKDCTELKEIYISDKLTSVEESAFTGCETLADVYYEGSESEWEKIVVGDNNEPLLNAKLHYDYGKDSWVSDGTFTLSKSGAWIAGKECALYGSYSASTQGNALKEAEEIVWSSSDSSIIDVSEAEINFDIASSDNNRVSIQRSFMAKTAGTVTITATAPDGRSASITVDVINSDDTGDISTSVLEYEKYQAKYYSENVSLITGGYMTYSAIEDNYTPTQYALANILSYGWTAKFGFTDSSEIWETLLLDILLQRTANISASGELENEILQLCNTLYDEAIKNDISNLKDNIDANVNNVNTLVSKYESLKGISTSKSVIGKLVEAAETVEDFINYYAKYVELQNYITDDTKVFLNKMQSTTVYNDIPAFQRALDNVIQHLSIDENKLAQLVIMETATDKLFTKAMNISIENIVNILIPGVSTVVDFTKDATICMMNAVLDTDELSQLNVYLYMLDSIDEAAKEAMEKSASEYLSSYGNNYRAVNGGLQFITDISSYGLSICRQWGSIVSTDILTKVSNKFLIASRPHYDVANDYFNLNHPSTINEKNQYIEELCLSDEKYIDSVLRSMPGIARMAWYKDSGASEDEISCLVLFYVLNPETGSKTVTATVVPQNFRVSFPELGVKSGYVTPTQWYLDEECTQVADSNQLITENTIFYTKWTRSIFYMLTESGGASIVSIDAQAERQTPFAINTLSKSIKNDPENGIYAIPAYIDGYRVETLGDDIFAGVSNVSCVSLPGTLLDISDAAFASVEKNVTFVYVEGSVAEKYILEKKYSNTESIKELYFKNTPGQMTIGETVQLELVQEGSCISDDVQWKSSEENVVSVEGGKLIAKDEGKSIISAQVGGVIASFEITVTKEDAGEDGHTHSYDVPEFIWSEDYTTCTAVFTCESCDDEQKIECDIISETMDPTCTEDGKTVYTAMASFAGKEYTDTQEGVITATGHIYEYTDDGDGTHTKACSSCDISEAEVHTYEEGTCKYCKAEEPKEHSHSYSSPEFEWSEDYTSCRAVFMCKDGDDVQRIDCEVTSETTNPTCTADGKTVYTATVSFAGADFTDTKEEVIPATEHFYEYTDNGDGTHTKVCNNGDVSETEPHTYVDGICEYCGAEKPEEHSHAYSSPEFEWSEDYQSCTAIFTCKDGDDVQRIDCEVTSETTDATCTEDGKTVYAATVNFAGATFTDEQTEIINATGHTYNKAEFEWSEDYQSCTAVFTCKDGDDEQRVECEVTSKTTDATCTEDGATVYTATVSFEGEVYTDTKKEAIPAGGHTYKYVDNGDDTHTKTCTVCDTSETENHTYEDGICQYCKAEEPKVHSHEYGKPKFEWSKDYQSCTAIFSCKDGDDEQRIECEVSSKTTDPTCTEDGKMEYTATVSFGGAEFTDTKEESIPSTGHIYEYADNGDGTHTKTCTICDASESEPHTYVDGICQYCKAEEPEEHSHEYGEPKFEWSKDNENCAAVFICEDGDDKQQVECKVTSKILTEATCTEDGTVVYSATASFEGQEYTDTKEATIPATGHTYEYTDNGDGTHTKTCKICDTRETENHTYEDGICQYCKAEEPKEHSHEYGKPKFEWSKDGKSCTAIFTCKDGDDEQRVECEVTSKITDSTCTEDGKTVYTATVSFAGAEFTDTKEESIPSAGHIYEYTDNGDGTHTKTCTICDESESEPHTYEDGTCKYCKAEEPEEHRHEYGKPKFEWSKDGKSCTAIFTCKDGDDEQRVECEVTSKTTDPTCTKDGKIVYKAVVSFEGEEYTDTKEKKIEATGHTYEYQDNGDGTHKKVCTSCGKSITESHDYQKGVCKQCGAEEPNDNHHNDFWYYDFGKGIRRFLEKVVIPFWEKLFQIF